MNIELEIVEIDEEQELLLQWQALLVPERLPVIIC